MLQCPDLLRVQIIFPVMPVNASKTTANGTASNGDELNIYVKGKIIPELVQVLNYTAMSDH